MRGYLSAYECRCVLRVCCMPPPFRQVALPGAAPGRTGTPLCLLAPPGGGGGSSTPRSETSQAEEWSTVIN